MQVIIVLCGLIGMSIAYVMLLVQESKIGAEQNELAGFAAKAGITDWYRAVLPMPLFGWLNGYVALRARACLVAFVDGQVQLLTVQQGQPRMSAFNPDQTTVELASRMRPIEKRLCC